MSLQLPKIFYKYPTISSANPLVLSNGNIFNVSGTTNFNTINGGRKGYPIFLRFLGILTITSGTGNIILDSNFTTAANSVLALFYNGTNWIEITRSKQSPATKENYTLNVLAMEDGLLSDGATVFFGNIPRDLTITSGQRKIYIRKNGIIKMAEIYVRATTAGTNEAWSMYIRKNDTSDTLIATLSVSSTERIFSNENLAISVSNGNYIEIKQVFPTWATNPATVYWGGYIYIENL